MPDLFVWNKDFDVEWSCPVDGSINLDNFQLTARPACYDCDREVEWRDIMAPAKIDQLNELWKEQDEPTTSQA
jgi:hypothetical protein